jgi:hypothetical protein
MNSTGEGGEGMEGKKPVEELSAEVVAALNKISIGKDIKKFFREIDGLANTLPLTMILLSVEAKRSRDSLDEKYSAKEMRGADGGLYVEYKGITAENISNFKKMEKRNGKAVLAMRIVPQSFLVSLISQYDAFVGTIIKSFYYLKPELLNASGKQFTFAELRKIGSIEAASEHIIEKEVDVVMRGSHVEQIEWLTKFSGVDLRKELKSWKTFVEITLRRNLFVHTGGNISQQYLDECKVHSIDVSQLSKGMKLDVSAKYFGKAYETILEVGLIIAQAIWRKLLPAQRADADNSLNDLCVDLIAEKRYALACKILDHVIEEFKHHHSTESNLLMMVINRAQSYKWNSDKNKACKILNEYDWSAKSNEFRLAVAVLLDNFSEAYRLMRVIGTTGTPSQEQYKDWPLFKEIRQEQEFAKAFEEIFNQPFGEIETKQPDHSIFDFGGSH